jgi:hypothetical protein
MQVPLIQHFLCVVQAIIVGYLFSRTLKFLWICRKKKKRATKPRGQTPAQRVDHMFKCSFDDLKDQLTTDDH